MSKQELVKELKAQEKELEEELSMVRRLIKKWGGAPNNKTEEDQGDMFPVLSSEASLSDLSRTKKAIRELIEYPVSLQVKDISKNLEREDIDVKRSTINNALKSLRENDEVVAYKLNNANQMVFYVNPEGVDTSDAVFPIKEDYRPNGITERDIEQFDFLDKE